MLLSMLRLSREGLEARGTSRPNRSPLSQPQRASIRIFSSCIVVRGALIVSNFVAGCADQVSTHTTADAYDSDRVESQSEMDGLSDTEMDGLSDTESQSEVDDRADIRDRVANDKCVVMDGGPCEADCMPVYSSNISEVYCAVEGVFFGCVPAVDTGFWDTGDEVTIGQFGACDVLRDDQKQYRYCFEGVYGLYWYYRHRDEGWCQGECPISPDAAPCE